MPRLYERILSCFLTESVMARRVKITRLTLATGLTCALTVFLILQYSPSKGPTISRGFLVDTPKCRILDIDPFDNSIAKFVWHHEDIVCSGAPSITYDDGDMLRINWTNINTTYRGDFSYCKYQPVIRHHSDFSFSYGKFRSSFAKDIKIKDDIIRVFCFSTSGDIIYKNFHSLIIPNETLSRRCDKNLQRHLSENKPREVMNVLMLGIDSVSRLNFMRQMPKTRKYILEDLDAIELLGYTKVADNTFVNVVPMTTGKYVSELPWDESMKNLPFDKYNFIWKNFSRSGYRTLYAEDAPDLSIFTYLKEGFHESPTDYYNRIFSVAAENDGSIWNENHNCIGDRLETDIVLKYVEDFITLYRNKSHFGFTFITRLSHDDVNEAGRADKPHLEFLKRVAGENLLENTILIYFSDHGVRFGDLRYTFIGKLEERLPFFFFVFPKWFKQTYPNIIKNMKINSKRLTTPFDIYETLKDILYFTGQVKPADVRNRGISLFSEIPRDRSCDNAAIVPHWCMCLQGKEMPVSSKVVVTAAEKIVEKININLNGQSKICETLKLKEVKKAVRLDSGNKDVTYHTHTLTEYFLWIKHFAKPVQEVLVYQLTLVTSPGDGLFEGTVIYDETVQDYHLPEDISRINKYGNQSKCITENFSLRKYCFCK